MTNQTPAARLMPCPFCGCTGRPERKDNAIGDYWLECVNCGAGTRLRENDETCIRDWNRRAPAAQPRAMPNIDGDWHQVSETLVHRLRDPIPAQALADMPERMAEAMNVITEEAADAIESLTGQFHEIEYLLKCAENQAKRTAIATDMSAEKMRLDTLEKAMAGISKDALDGGWTALGLSRYAKSLEEKMTASAQGGGVPEGYELMAVKDFHPLIVALDRAERKGYLPDALTAEWEAFDFSAPSQPPLDATMQGSKFELEQLRTENADLRHDNSRLLSIASEEATRADDIERDAARYRWLREQHWNEADMAVVCYPKRSVKLGFDCPSGQRLDEAIDAAIAKGKAP